MQTTIKRVLNTPYAFWLILALPSLAMINGALSGRDLESLLHPTGEFAARLMIIAMMLTPLQMLLPKSGTVHWLMQRRRYLGVAAFGYAALHTLYYVVDLGLLSTIIEQLTELGIWTGWIAFLIFVPMALTSNQVSVRRLGPAWKPLQRLVYLAAVLTLVHWIFVANNLGPALVHFVPLALLEIYRLWKTRSKNGLAGATQ